MIMDYVFIFLKQTLFIQFLFLLFTCWYPEASTFKNTKINSLTLKFYFLIKIKQILIAQVFSSTKNQELTQSVYFAYS
jgi:hypothetical protein